MEATGLSFRALLSRFLLSAVCCVYFSLPVLSATPPCDSSCEQAKQFYFAGQLDIAANHLSRLSNQGIAEASYYLALIYLDENWSNSDQSRGLALLLTAADQNHAEAMWKIGSLYDNGTVVEKDLMKATDWYRKSAQYNKEYAHTSVLYINSDENRNLSPQQQLESHIQAANKNDIQSMLRLAYLYDTGYMLEQDMIQAYYWYHRAALMGDEYAMYMTGYFLCRGLAQEVNMSKANFWLTKSSRDTTCHNK